MLDRVAFTLGMFMMLYPALLGYWRPLMKILSFKLFNVMSKLTYGTYMFHVIIVIIF